MGSDESHFTVSLIVKGKFTKMVSLNHNFWTERRAEAESNLGPFAYQLNALPLDQTGTCVAHVEPTQIYTNSQPRLGLCHNTLISARTPKLHSECCYVLHGWFATCLILLPHVLVLFRIPLIQTGHKIAGFTLTVMFFLTNGMQTHKTS